jgi:hypothetical protein
MRLRILVAAMLAAGVALVPTAAAAKGAKEMTVSGPGLATPLRLANTAEAALSPNTIAQKSGLFAPAPARFSDSRPPGDLGPLYVATYDWLIGANSTTPLHQELYPFTDGGAVVYTPARQHVGVEVLPSGWYRAGPELTLLLVAAGVPVPAGYAAPAPVAAKPPLAG